MEQDAKQFIDELEKKRGSKVLWRTYATWYASNKGVQREYGVFLYRCGDTFFFEDFERTPSFLGFAMKPGKNAVPYQKYEGTIPLTSIVSSKQVTKQTALKVAGGSLKADNAKSAKGLQKLFSSLVEMVTLSDGNVYFFELMDRKAFLKQCTKEK